MLLHSVIKQITKPTTTTTHFLPSTRLRTFHSSTSKMSSETLPLRASASSILELSEYSTCEISDSLLKVNPSSCGGYIPDLEIFSEGPIGTNLVGEAFTVKMVDTKDTNAPKLSGHFVDSAPSGSVLVISSPSHVKSASFGGLLGLGASVKGVQGVIVDGRCRDLKELRALELPVFARGHSTLGQSPFTRPSQIQIPLVISPFPNTTSTSSDSSLPSWPSQTVNPYDLILADLDGVIVIRPSELEKVLELARIGREVDERCRNDIEAGRGVGETFKDRRSGGIEVWKKEN